MRTAQTKQPKKTKTGTLAFKAARRPTTLTIELRDKICRCIEQGHSIRETAKLLGIKDHSQILVWVREDAEFYQQYRRAQEMRADGMFDQLVALSDEATPEDAHAMRLRIDTRKWVLGRMSPKYAEKQGLDVSVSFNLEQIVLDSLQVAEQPADAPRVIEHKPPTD